MVDAYLSSSETRDFLSSFLFLSAFQASLIPSVQRFSPFSASNLPVARNKPPLPWLLPCRIFPWVSTVAFLSHCIAPCHRDDDVGHYHDDSRGPRGWRFVCLFSFPPPLRTTTFLESGRRCAFYRNRLYLRRFLHFWQINCVRL